MCLICVEWEKQRMTSKEAMKAIGESLLHSNKVHTEHLIDLSEKIISSEVPLNATDSEADALWTDENRK
jgi:hypothetical protein